MTDDVKHTDGEKGSIYTDPDYVLPPRVVTPLELEEGEETRDDH